MKKRPLLPFIFALLLHGTCMAQINWSSANSGLPANSYVNGFAYGGGIIYTVLNASAQGQLYASANNGASWSNVSASGLPTGAWANSLFNNGGTLLLGSNTLGSSLYASTDAGQTWAASNSGLPTGADVNGFAAINGTIFITVNASLQGQLYASSNSGASWSSVSSSGLPSGAWGGRLFAVGNTLLLGSNTLGSSLYISNDNGQTWAASNSGLPSGADVNGFAATTDGTIYITVNASAQGQLYSSSNGGSSWSAVSTTGLPSGAWAGSLFISGSISLMGTNGMGSYLYSSNVSTGIQLTAAPVAVQCTVYPNPNRGGNWQLSVGNSLVGSALQVFDEEGRLVSNSKLETQNSKLDLNIPSGVYYLRISNDNTSVVRKLVKI